jgi:hypothetical protein
MDKLTTEELEGLKEDLKRVKNHLPEDLMGKFWGLCNKIRNEKTNQPCSCPSSAGLWGSCVNDLRSYIKLNEQ